MLLLARTPCEKGGLALRVTLNCCQTDHLDLGAGPDDAEARRPVLPRLGRYAADGISDVLCVLARLSALHATSLSRSSDSNSNSAASFRLEANSSLHHSAKSSGFAFATLRRSVSSINEIFLRSKL